MTKINFNLTTFTARMQEIREGLDQKKWINASLEVQDRENGFVRFLKVLILPIARLFDADPFAHVRADKVALAIVAEYSKHEKDLTLEQKTQVFQILGALKKKTNDKYAPVFQAAIPFLNKSIAKSLPSPALVSSDIAASIKANLDAVIKDDSDQPSHYFPSDHTGPIPPPPPPPPEDGLKKEPKPEEPPKAIEPKPANLFAVNDKLEDVFGKKPAIASQDQKLIVNLFNSPLQKHGIGKLSQQIDAFIDALEQTTPDEDSIYTEVDEDLLEDVETHQILGRFYKEYPTIPKDQRQAWLDKTIAYLQDVVLEDIKKVKAKNAVGTKASIEAIKKHDDQVQAKALLEKFDKLKAERESLIQEITFDLSQVQGIVKRKKWEYHLSKNSLSPLMFNELALGSKDWLQDCNAETLQRIKANKSIDLDFAKKTGDEELVMIAKFHLVSTIISTWKQENR